jgi:hypothetical protein
MSQAFSVRVHEADDDEEEHLKGEFYDTEGRISTNVGMQSLEDHNREIQRYERRDWIEGAQARCPAGKLPRRYYPEKCQNTIIRDLHQSMQILQNHRGIQECLPYSERPLLGLGRKFEEPSAKFGKRVRQFADHCTGGQGILRRLVGQEERV